VIEKPERIFDRDFEWRGLASFAAGSGSTARLAIVSGRRRQGKTYLVEALARATGGLYFSATEATEAESLQQFARALAGWTKAPAPPLLPSWDEAIGYLFTVNAERSALVVIDEFPYLSKASPALPSIIQRELDRNAMHDRPGSLLLCGSAMAVMGRLLAGSAPLRGRAGLELIVRPFDHLTAARFWRIQDPRLAVLVHSVVGGTAAYRQFAGGRAPGGVDEFNQWVLDTVLNPATPLFREARYLLEEETDVRDRALYHSVLSAVANGNNTRGGIANFIGRKAADIGHHLNVLEDAALLTREPDLFRSGRSTYRVAEPLLVFYQVVMRPQWGLLESGRAAQVWRSARARFLAQVVGPHFEQLAREHALAAPEGTFAELPGEVGSGLITDPARRTQIQLDVVVLAPAVPGKPRRVLALGEAKWGDVMGKRHVERLRRARDLLVGRGYDATGAALMCYGGAGFEPALAALQDTLTIDPDRLYAAPDHEV
jgi:AAA+ ATPase superfamily predicted ATPase